MCPLQDTDILKQLECIDLFLCNDLLYIVDFRDWKFMLFKFTQPITNVDEPIESFNGAHLRRLPSSWGEHKPPQETTKI